MLGIRAPLVTGRLPAPRTRRLIISVFGRGPIIPARAINDLDSITG